MKTKLHGLIVLTMLVVFASCSKDEINENDAINQEIDLSIVVKNDVQMSQDILDLVNDHRQSIGLNTLVMDQAYASAYAVDHTDYMIELSQINHDNFHIRSKALKDRGAVRVGENVAYGYDDAESVVNSWLNSPAHKEVIEGNYTHSGFGVFKNDKNRYFFTQLFYLK
ncbi:MAG: CAP domain-containing protein [Flavobacteriaceae bacterium]|nr:CAP domain-containing protein [Flavobacteriaceae bacterium]